MEGLVAGLNAAAAGLYMSTDENAHPQYVMVMIISRLVEPLCRLVMVMCLSCSRLALSLLRQQQPLTSVILLSCRHPG